MALQLNYAYTIFRHKLKKKKQLACPFMPCLKIEWQNLYLPVIMDHLLRTSTSDRGNNS